MSKAFIPLGVVARPFGIRGELRVRPHNPRTTWFDSAEGVWIRNGADQAPEYYKVLHSKKHKEFVILVVEGVRDRDQAEAMRGREVVVPEDELKPLDEGEFYWYQLIGLAVETGEGKPLGELVRIEETDPDLDGNDVFVVRGEEGELLVPATREAVLRVSLAEGKMVLNAEAVIASLGTKGEGDAV